MAREEEMAKVNDQPVSAESEAPAWELVEEGRYRPRRIRGSCLGRELG
jgi:hypothetical protein